MPALLSLPPFPNNVPTHPLLVVDYNLLKVRDKAEVDKLWTAATELGFWYLKNHGVDDHVHGMFEMGAETMALPFDVKMAYEQGDSGMSFGYKAAGANATDANGSLDSVEFINVSKDDAIAWPLPVHRLYPETVNARMELTIKPFVQKSLDVNNTFLEIFNDKLGLPEGTLSAKHTLEEHSGSETRCIKKPPSLSGEVDEVKAAIGAHTDFGSVTFLHNRLGGLQVMVPGTNEWQYVKPIPGHAICNLGDSMAIFSAGILKSNLHRVVPPPGEQAKFERWSLAFFTRPGDSVVLRALDRESPMIADALSKASDSSIYTSNSTSKEWFARRIKNQRIKNREGPQTWLASRGTEHQILAK